MLWSFLFVVVLLGASAVKAQVNVAVGKPTTQLSECFLGTSARAIDTDTNPQWVYGSCTHTCWNPNPWWAVDLEQDYDIVRIVIHNRGDCCGERLRNVEVYSYDRLPVAGQTPSSSDPGAELCGTFTGPSSNGAVVQISCAKGFSGRYIVVQLAGITEWLTLCEVMIMGIGDAVPITAETNLAAGRPTAQSSEAFWGVSSRAIDTDTNQQWVGASCTHTNFDANPWWAVNLEAEYDISKVVIYNRADCCGERLRNAVVYSTSYMPSPGTSPSSAASGSNICANFPGPSSNAAIVELTCSEGFSAQYVVIQLSTTEWLTLCEVEIYGGGDGSGATGGGDCEASIALQERVDELEAELAAAQQAKTASEQARRNAEKARKEAEDALARVEAEKAAALQAQREAEQAKAAAESALSTCQGKVSSLEADLLEATKTPDPVMPTASPTATLSSTAHEFTLPLNGISYILETTPTHVALKADDFCEQYGMKLAQVENDETLAALALQFKSIQAGGTTLSEVATGERSAVNLDRDVSTEAFNAAGWSCVTVVPDGDDFKLVSKKCQGERAILCAAVPLYC